MKCDARIDKNYIICNLCCNIKLLYNYSIHRILLLLSKYKYMICKKNIYFNKNVNVFLLAVNKILFFYLNHLSFRKSATFLDNKNA